MLSGEAGLLRWLNRPAFGQELSPEGLKLAASYAVGWNRVPLVPKASGPWGRTSYACLSPTHQSSPTPIIPCSWVTKEKPGGEEGCQGSPSPSWGAESLQIADVTMHSTGSIQIVSRMEGKTPKDLMSTLLWMRKTRSREQRDSPKTT